MVVDLRERQSDSFVNLQIVVPSSRHRSVNCKEFVAVEVVQYRIYWAIVGHYPVGKQLKSYSNLDFSFDQHIRLKNDFALCNIFFPLSQHFFYCLFCKFYVFHHDKIHILPVSLFLIDILMKTES